MADRKSHTSDQSRLQRRNVLKLVGASSVGLGSLAGCVGGQDGGNGGDSDGGGGDGQDSDGGTTADGDWPDLSGQELHFLTDENSSDMQDFFGRVAQDFEEATGASVQMEFGQQGTSVEQRLAQLLQAGDPPELFTTSVSQGTRLVYQRDILRPLNPVMEDVSSEYSEPITGARLTRDDDDYLIPWTASGDALWYRADIFDEGPETWDDMLAQAEKHDDQNGTRAYFQPAKQDFCTLIVLLSWAYTNEARVAQRQDGEVQIIMGEGKYRERWVETLEFMKELHQYAPLAADASCAEQVQAVASGAAASTPYPARVKINAIDTKPEMASDLHPTLIPKKRTHITNGVVEGLVSFDGSNGEVADTYVDFLFEDDYLMEFYNVTPVHLGPPYQAIQESDRYQELLDNLPEQWSREDVEISFEQNEKMLSLATETDPPNPYAGAISGSGHLSQMAHDVLVNDADPGAVVDETASKVAQALEDAKE